MVKFLKYQQDLEDAFKLDCTEEDIKTDKEAKRCCKVLKKYRKRTKQYCDFLRKIGVIADYQYKNKKFNKEKELYNMSYRSDNNRNSSSGGIGFVGMLTIVFIVLKLCKVINWSWLWVLSPLWISTAIAVLLIVIAVVIAALNNRD